MSIIIARTLTVSNESLLRIVYSSVVSDYGVPLLFRSLFSLQSPRYPCASINHSLLLECLSHSNVTARWQLMSIGPDILSLTRQKPGCQMRDAVDSQDRSLFVLNLRLPTNEAGIILFPFKKNVVLNTMALVCTLLG